jgi:hypothetical protein
VNAGFPRNRRLLFKMHDESPASTPIDSLEDLATNAPF